MPATVQVACATTIDCFEGLHTSIEAVKLVTSRVVRNGYRDDTRKPMTCVMEGTPDPVAQCRAANVGRVQASDGTPANIPGTEAWSAGPGIILNQYSGFNAAVGNPFVDSLDCDQLAESVEPFCAFERPDWGIDTVRLTACNSM